MASAIQICSLNVRGLGEQTKRREIFNWLRTKTFSIFMLQEFHCVNENIPIYLAEWGYQGLFSCCSGSKAGVSILFNNNVKLQIQKTFCDPGGRFIICDIKMEQMSLTLENIYAPNKDDSLFFQSFFEKLGTFKCDEIIIGGDFNLVLDTSKDKMGGLNKMHQNSVQVIHEYQNALDLVDVWRTLNKDDRRHTWRRRNPEIHCRLDFFLVSQTILYKTTKADILPGYKTDHSMITLNFSLHSNQRGRGLWKLNTSFLSQNDYVNEICAQEREAQQEYQGENSISPVLLWETIKLKVREKSISYAVWKNKSILRREEDVEQSIAQLEREIENHQTTEETKKHLHTRLEAQKEDLKKIIEYRTQGAIKRTKVRWYNEGEKNTSYFLSLEKSHCRQQTITQLKTCDNSGFVTTDKEILNETELFYRNLYSSSIGLCEEFDPSFPHENANSLDAEEQKLCEGKLTKKECLEALKSMDSDKSPGTDGLPVEFYKVFWNNISGPLIEALNHAYQNGELPITQRRGVIRLIPKKDADPHLIKNWRPITLLNCDYKIAAKAIAGRIKKVLPKIINEDQTGFLKGRTIGENIKLIDDIIKFTDKNQLPGLLLFVDFEKAFDTLEWSFIEKSLHYHGFGPSLVAWFRVFYSNIESCIINNGWCSKFFKLERGVRQGCPLSPYLFLLCAEILAIAIRSNKKIKGITVKETEIKISQYADDTTLVLDGSKSSLSATLETSGLRLNNKKTEALWIGSCKGSEEVFFPEKTFNWPKLKVKALGILFSTDPLITINTNYEKKMKKVKNCLNCWELRRLSLIGKITVLKSLIASQLVYILVTLPTCEPFIREINQIFFDFLWSGRGDKIKRNIMINDYPDGGLKMIDIQSFNKSLKTTWIKKYLDPNNRGKWKLFFEIELQPYGGSLLFECNLKEEDINSSFNFSDLFLIEVLGIWCELNYQDVLTSSTHFHSQILWNNSLIRIGKKPIFYKKWFQKGIVFVKDLLKGNSSQFLSHVEFQTAFRINVNILEYLGIISALKELRKSFPQQLRDPNTTTQQVFGKVFLQTQKPGKLAYKKLIQRKSITPKASQEKWLKDCDIPENQPVQWRRVFTCPFKYTKCTKLITFHFKLMHRRIATNTFLNKIGIKASNKCSFCEDEPEHLLHLFWNCPKTSSFWNNLIA